MIITVDVDFEHWEVLRTNIAIGLDYGFKLLRVVKSPSRRGYHIVWRTHKGRVKDLHFFDVHKELLDIVIKRIETARYYKIDERGTKEDVIRVILGDDPYRVIYDIKRRNVMPEQVLFRSSKYYGECRKKRR